MTDSVLYGAMGATGAPMTSTLVTIDGSLVMAVGLAMALLGGVLLSAAARRWWASRRVTLRHTARVRRVAA